MDLAKPRKVNILSINSGSSTLKFAVFDKAAEKELATGVFEQSGGDVSSIFASLAAQGIHDPIDTVGHRVVHGGTAFRETTLIDAKVFETLEETTHLAPLHNPPALKMIAAMRRVLPEADHFAVFDTSFFAELPPRSTTYPLPYEWSERFGIRRYGFHGISHAYCTTRAAELLGRKNDSDLRLVICHLGSGCSASAVLGGHPVETTMGFTPMEGLMMATRSGSMDPGILLHLLKEKGFSADQLDESLNHHSGLLGVSGISSDFRVLQTAARSGNQRAQLALDMFVDRIRAAIGALAVTLGGIDALVFTGGIGEHSITLRSRVCKGLSCLSLLLDEEKNQCAPADSDIAQTGSKGRILTIHTREELMIARECATETYGARGNQRGQCYTG